MTLLYFLFSWDETLEKCVHNNVLVQTIDCAGVPSFHYYLRLHFKYFASVIIYRLLLADNGNIKHSHCLTFHLHYFITYSSIITSAFCYISSLGNDNSLKVILLVSYIIDFYSFYSSSVGI